MNCRLQEHASKSVERRFSVSARTDRFLSCQCCCLAGEIVDGAFDTRAFLLEPGIEFRPEIDEFIHIAVDRQAVLRYGPLGVSRPLGNNASNVRQRQIDAWSFSLLDGF